MTQKEFDLQMNEFRRAESEEKFPIDTELAQLTQKRRYLGQQIDSLERQVGGGKNADSRTGSPTEGHRSQVLGTKTCVYLAKSETRNGLWVCLTCGQVVSLG